MKNLTKEELKYGFNNWTPPQFSSDSNRTLESLWSRIEADREAIRAETESKTREELLKDHFKLGEYGEVFTAGKWLSFRVFGSLEGGYILERKEQESVRRPPKKRAMTGLARRTTAHNLPTEVEE